MLRLGMHTDNWRHLDKSFEYAVDAAVKLGLDCIEFGVFDGQYFIQALGYYITPALVGGADDQMISYFIAFYASKTVNWGMAAALSIMLLAATLALYAVYNRMVGVERMRLG